MPRAVHRFTRDCTLRRNRGSSSSRKYGRWRKDSCTSTTISACFMDLRSLHPTLSNRQHHAVRLAAAPPLRQTRIVQKRPSAPALLPAARDLGLHYGAKRLASPITTIPWEGLHAAAPEA